MNALEDLEEYDRLRLKVCIHSELFEDLTLRLIETTISRQPVMVGFKFIQAITVPDRCTRQW